MKTSLRIARTSGALVALLCAGGLVACTTTEADVGGTGGSGGGSTTPVGSGGTGPAGGSTGGDGTLCPAPQQVITDFTYASLDAGVSTTEVRFGSAGSLQGGEAYYPNSGTYPLTVDVTQSNYHITGTVGDYSGIRLYFDNCDHLDASQFEGISFTISGSVQGDAIQFGVVSAGNTPTWSWLKANGKTDAKETDIGRCTPSETTNNQYYHPGCDDPTAPIPVTSTPTTNRVTWDKLTGGKPEPSPNPKEITAIYWVIPWSGTGAPYAVDLVLDDLHFFP